MTHFYEYFFMIMIIRIYFNENCRFIQYEINYVEKTIAKVHWSYGFSLMRSRFSKADDQIVIPTLLLTLTRQSEDISW